MADHKETIDIKVNSDFSRYSEGEVLTMPARGGLPRDTFWQRRLRDAVVDGCCEVVQPKKTKATKAATPNAAVEETDR